MLRRNEVNARGYIRLISVITFAAAAAPLFAASAAPTLSAEIYYDHNDKDRDYGITVLDVEPPLSRDQLTSDVVRLIDRSLYKPVPVEIIKGNETVAGGLSDIVYLYGHFDPEIGYNIEIVYSPEDIKECPVELAPGDAVADTNWTVTADFFVNRFVWDLDLYVPEDVDTLGLGFDMDLRAYSWKCGRLALAAEGLVKTDQYAPALQSEITGSGYFQLLKSYGVPVKVRTSEGRKSLRLRYYWGVQVDLLEVEANQGFNVVDFTYKAQGLLYFPLNLVSFCWYDIARGIGLARGDRPIRPPYVIGGIKGSYSRDVEAGVELGPETRADLEARWEFPLSDKADLVTSYRWTYFIGDLEVGQKRTEEFVDLRIKRYLDDEYVTAIEAGFQQGKVPPEFRHDETVFAGFAAGIM